VDDEAREALRAERLNPDDPAVVSPLDTVRWELSCPFTQLSSIDVKCSSFSRDLAEVIWQR
jgi:hypothetical protein